MEGHARTADVRLGKYFPDETFELQAEAAGHDHIGIKDQRRDDPGKRQLVAPSDGKGAAQGVQRVGDRKQQAVAKAEVKFLRKISKRPPADPRPHAEKVGVLPAGGGLPFGLDLYIFNIKTEIEVSVRAQSAVQLKDSRKDVVFLVDALQGRRAEIEDRQAPSEPGAEMQLHLAGSQGKDRQIRSGKLRRSGLALQAVRKEQAEEEEKGKEAVHTDLKSPLSLYCSSSRQLFSPECLMPDG